MIGAILLVVLGGQPLFVNDAARGAHPPQLASAPDGAVAVLLPQVGGPAQLAVVERGGKVIGKPRTLLKSSLFAKFTFAPELKAWGVVAVREGSPRVVVFAKVAVDGRAPVEEWELPDSVGCGGDGRLHVAWSTQREAFLTVFSCERAVRLVHVSPTGRRTSQTLEAFHPSAPVWRADGWLVAGNTAEGARLFVVKADGEISSVGLPHRFGEALVVVNAMEVVVVSIDYEGGAYPVRVSRLVDGEVSSRVVLSTRERTSSSLAAPALFPSRGGGYDLIVSEQGTRGGWPGHLVRLRLGPELEPKGEAGFLVPDDVTAGWASAMVTPWAILVATHVGDPNDRHKVVVHQAAR